MAIKVRIATSHDLVFYGLAHILMLQNPNANISQIPTGHALVAFEEDTPDKVVIDLTHNEFSISDLLRSHSLSKNPNSYVFLLNEFGVVHVNLAVKAKIGGIITLKSSYSEIISCLNHRNTASYVAKDVAQSYTAESADPTKEKLLSLTDKEVLILKRLCLGCSTRSTAEAMNISQKTVHSYKTKIMHKLGIDDTEELIKTAIDNKIYKA